MANQVQLPQMGLSEESAVIGEFYVSVGDAVQVGTRLFSIETGKSVFDVESEFEGEVLAFFCEEGDELPIQAPVMVIGKAGETYEAPKAEANKPQAEKEEKADSAPKPVAAAEPVFTGAVQDVLSSPRARTLADKAGVNVAQALPTGRRRADY